MERSIILTWEFFGVRASADISFDDKPLHARSRCIHDLSKTKKKCMKTDASYLGPLYSVKEVPPNNTRISIRSPQSGADVTRSRWGVLSVSQF